MRQIFSRQIFTKNRRSIKDRSLIGLALIATTAGWVIGIGVRNRRRKAGEIAAPPAAAPPTGLIPQLEPLVMAIQNLAESALTLVELRQLNHWLNSKQWYFAHEQQARTETDATERYENTITDLLRQSDGHHMVFRGPIDEYRTAIQRTVSADEYTPPDDTSQRDRVIQYRQRILQQIEEIFADGANSDESS